MRSLWISLALLSPALAIAQNKSSDDNVARADALFREAQAMRSIDLNGACAKFVESYELNPHALGTLLNVALCDEELGRLASALEKFTLARDIAAETLAKGPDRAAAESKKASVEHIKKLTPRIPHVTIEFVPPVLPDSTIVIDGRAYAKDKLGKLAVDPGSHTIVVSAPGYLPYETTFAIAEGEHHNVAIPNLEKSVTVRSTRRTIGVIVGGAGALAGATGIVVGLVARSRYNDVTSCHDDDSCDLPEDYTKRKNALSLGNVGTVVGLAGAGAIVVGAILWYTGRRSTAEKAPSSVTLLPHVDSDGAGITAVGRF
jgi:hypothetical protein